MINPLTLKAKIIVGAIVGVALLSTGFYGGWRVKSALIAERDLAIKEASAEFKEAYQTFESDIAFTLDEKLKNLKSNERVVYRETQKIIERPIYSNECLDADGLRLIERARAGKPDTSKPAK